MLQHIVLLKLLSPCVVRRRSSLLVTRGQPTAVTWMRWTTASGAWCRSACTELQFVMWPSNLPQRLIDTYTIRYIKRAAKSWRVASLTSKKIPAEHGGRCHWPSTVVNNTGSLYSGRWWPLWTPSVTLPEGSWSWSCHITSTGSFQSHSLFLWGKSYNFGVWKTTEIHRLWCLYFTL